jgi:hypothetical protein
VRFGPGTTPAPDHSRPVLLVRGASYTADEAGYVRFCLPDQNGQERWLRLDEIPLAPTAPAAWPRSSVARTVQPHRV